MSFRSTVHSKRPRRPLSWVRPAAGRHAARPWLEALEYRCLLSGTATLTPNDDSVLVGERVTWTATAADVGASPVYQFSAAPHGGAFHVVRDFSPASAFTWTPMQEGTYEIEVTVKDGYQATDTTSAVAVDENWLDDAAQSTSMTVSAFEAVLSWILVKLCTAGVELPVIRRR